jgi:hypothetical protein
MSPWLVESSSFFMKTQSYNLSDITEVAFGEEDKIIVRSKNAQNKDVAVSGSMELKIKEDEELLEYWRSDPWFLVMSLNDEKTVLVLERPIAILSKVP